MDDPFKEYIREADHLLYNPNVFIFALIMKENNQQQYMFFIITIKHTLRFALQAD